MSHCARSQIASASAPAIAVATSKYAAVRRASSSFTFAGMSSTTRMRAVILDSSGRSQKMAYRLDELANRDRLRQIRLASALADTLLVALHRKRRHRHHGNRLQLRIVLKPFGDLKAGYLGKLDVHDDQIRAVLAREIQRLDTVAGTDSAVTMSFQQIVEELHVELVVLHDQDSLGHPALRLPHL